MLIWSIIRLIKSSFHIGNSDKKVLAVKTVNTVVFQKVEQIDCL